MDRGTKMLKTTSLEKYLASKLNAFGAIYIRNGIFDCDFNNESNKIAWIDRLLKKRSAQGLQQLPWKR